MAGGVRGRGACIAGGCVGGGGRGQCRRRQENPGSATEVCTLDFTYYPKTVCFTSVEGLA